MSTASRSSGTIRNIFELPPTTHDHLFRDLSVKDLLYVSKASRAANAAVKEFHKRAFRIENILSPYFNHRDIRAFRILQFTFGVLIGGSTALSFFERYPYPDSDLDLYVEFRYCGILAHFLEGVGYRYSPAEFVDGSQPKDLTEAIEHSIRRASPTAPDRSEQYDLKGMTGVFTFVRDNGKKIEVIASRANPFEVLLGYHSTVVLNIVSYSYAISLYPRSTLLDRVALKLHVRTTKAAEACEKYEKRGWTMITSVDAATAVSRNSDLNMFVRHLNDRFCWRIPLDPVDDFVPGISRLGDGVLELLQSWKLDFIDWKKTCMDHGEISGKHLMQSYCVCEEALTMLRASGLVCGSNAQCSEYHLNAVLVPWYQRLFPDEDPVRDELIRGYSKLEILYPALPISFRPSPRSAEALQKSLGRIYQVLRRQSDQPSIRFLFEQTCLESSESNVWTNVMIGYPLQNGEMDLSPLRLELSELDILREYRITLTLRPIRPVIRLPKRNVLYSSRIFA
ncbi:hypothetical protein Moror_8700 [Moniliophthora roreri MCA 2997]|uniref:F-box domain-containing protein n=1 Tax=Moniliophthora roreri (strain MCA 2997) TaxID=1381753 RepID=V2X728_MONRO|nr:hypothetical protein Moror_8700 [Moniliophthora roreri MCA 2997]KAI3602190.1 hypothetical protein WG66_002511 [Moniliophthora roreri]